MQQIAIDLGGRKSQVCARSSDGEIVEERSYETRSLRAYLRQRPPSRVVIETCAEAFGVADAALELGHQVRVVPATLVRALGGRSTRDQNRSERRATVERGVLSDGFTVGAHSVEAVEGMEIDVRDARGAGQHEDQAHQHGTRMAASRGVAASQRSDRDVCRAGASRWSCDEDDEWPSSRS